jgi:LysM repeat protein
MYPFEPPMDANLLSKLRRLCLCSLAWLLALMQTTDLSAATQHQVVRAETLSGIAKQYGVSVSQLRTWNQLPSDAIQVGQRLTVDFDQYAIRAGDTLSQIALRFGLTLEKLRHYNGLKTHHIAVGQILRLQPPQRNPHLIGHL